MSDQAPQVEMDFPTHWCPRHLEPFRANWPAGAGLAMVRLAGLAFEHPDIVAAATKDSDGKAKVESLNAVLREFSPLCCLVGDAALEPVYREAGVDPA